MGCSTWPDDSEFDVCPTCRGKTKRYKGVKPLRMPDAMSVKRHAEFDSYYATQHIPDLISLTDEDCAKRGIEVVHPENKS